MNDLEFLRRFKHGLKSSATFRSLQITPGNYGKIGDQDNLVQKLIAIELEATLEDYPSPIALFEDRRVNVFDFLTQLGCVKNLIFHAVRCSALLNLALRLGAKEGFAPLADAPPYGDLLGAKYSRAIDRLEAADNKIRVTDLSFAILDELVPAERLAQLSLEDVVRYRKASEKEREAFLEHLSVLQAKQANIGLDGDYRAAINSLVTTEIVPAARAFKNKLQTIADTLFGAILKRRYRRQCRHRLFR